MSKIYIQYAEMLGEISELELRLADRKRSIREITNELEKEPSCGLTLSAHAFTNISERLANLASDSDVIYTDLFNVKDPDKSIAWPSQMKTFIISMIANSYSKNEFEEKPSKNGNGKEYHYTIELKKWSKPDKALIFTAIVESGVIKTGYFNWIGR